MLKHTCAGPGRFLTLTLSVLRAGGGGLLQGEETGLGLGGPDKVSWGSKLHSNQRISEPPAGTLSPIATGE